MAGIDYENNIGEPEDIQELHKEMEKYVSELLFDAIVVSRDGDFSDKYFVDIYGKGYNSPATQSHVTALNLNLRRVFIVNERLKVRITATGFAIIPQQLGEPTGLYQVPLSVDEDGNWVWDYLRFIDVG